MRNPIRPKNLDTRYFPYYAVGLAILIFHRPRPESFALALPLIVAGAALRGWGAGHLQKNRALTTSGPYAHLRHPLYLGTILVGTGFAVMLGGWLALAVVACAWPWFGLSYMPRKERSESARLESLYGDAFRRYRDAVPALWPRLQAWRETADANAPPAPGATWRLERYSDNNEFGALLAILSGIGVFALRAAAGG